MVGYGLGRRRAEGGGRRRGAETGARPAAGPGRADRRSRAALNQ